MNKKIYVTDLPSYFTKQIEELFFVREAVLHETINKKKYINLFLQDKMGTIGGIMWQEYIKEGFLELKGHVVRINGMVVQNQKEQYEILVNNMEDMEDYDQSEFVNGLTQEGTVKYLNYLYKYIDDVEDKGYSALLRSIFNKEKEKFAILPATLKSHHDYNGGFLVYTITLTSLVKYMSRTLSFYNFHPSYSIPYNTSLLITASLLHAVGVVRMITPFPDLKRISISRLLGQHEHTIQYVQESILELQEEILTEEDKALLIHTISCVYESNGLKPMFREALLLKQAYQLLENVTKLEYFINYHTGEEGCIYDEQLNNYLYMQMKKEMPDE